MWRDGAGAGAAGAGAGGKRMSMRPMEISTASGAAEDWPPDCGAP
jgi:hypothetical protein